MTLTDNTAPNNNGGGLYTNGPVRLTNCTLAHNTAGNGGGIYNDGGGTMTLTDSYPEPTTRPVPGAVAEAS